MNSGGYTDLDGNLVTRENNANDFLFMLNTYADTKTEGATIKRSLRALFGAPETYGSIGGGLAAPFIKGAAMKTSSMTARQMLMLAAKTAGYTTQLAKRKPATSGVVAGIAYADMYEGGQMILETAAGAPPSLQEAVTRALTTTAAGAAIGGTLGKLLGSTAEEVGPAVREGVVSAGEAAEARMAERGPLASRVMSGVDPMEVIDPALAAAGKMAKGADNPNQAMGDALAKAQVRYFETGQFEPPTAENPISVVLPTETEPGIIAFHGSGADFDEFRLEMIGTGEGAQAYGYGLYFTDSEDIAKFYRETVGKRKQGLPTSIPDDPNDVAGALAQDIGFKEGVFGDTGLLQINSGDPDYDFFIKMLDDNAVETTQAGVAKTYEFNDGSVITLSDEATPVFKGKALDTVYTSDVEYMFESEIQDIIKRAQEMGMPGDRASLRSDIVTVLSQLGQGLGSKRDMYTAVESLAPSYGGPPSRYMTIYNQFIEPNTDIQTVSTLTELGSKRGKIYKVGLSPKPDELLDYDLPLNQQPRVVQKLMENLVGDLLAGEPENYDRFDFKALAAIRGESPTEGYSPTGDDILTDLQRFLETGPNQSRRAAMDASKILNDFGIPGIKYRAAGSRGPAVSDAAAERNYVIFDDKAIKILEKYGIVGPVAVTGVAAGQGADSDEGEAM